MRMRQPGIGTEPGGLTLCVCAICGRKFTAPGKEYTIPVCLTVRESQIVQLVQQARTNKEIAAALQLSPGTAKQYLYTLFRKLGVRNRTELAIWAREHEEVWSREATVPLSHTASSSTSAGGF